MEEEVRLIKSPRSVSCKHLGVARSMEADLQADWSEGLRKKKQAGVGDMTLLSTITNEAINDNLKARFNNQEIYVSFPVFAHVW